MNDVLSVVPVRHQRTPSLEPSAGIHFAALHTGLERVAAHLKRNPTASKDPFGPPMLFTSAHRGPSIARLVQTTSILDWRDSDPGTSINFWNRIGMTDSNFALDAGQSRAEDSARRMSPKATLPRCKLFSNASTLPGTSRAITFFRSNRRCLRRIR
jgi:hypothetical protein